MKAGLVRFCALLSLVTLVAACDADRGLAPDPPLFANGGPNASTAPSNLTATALAFDQIKLVWRDNTTNETGFEYHWSTSGAAGPFTLYSDVTANVQSVTIGGFAGSTQYCFKVRSYVIKGRNKATFSEFSNVACAITPATPLPPAPTGALATPYGGYAVSITWTAEAGAQNDFMIERTLGTQGYWTAIAGTNGDARQVYDWFSTRDVEICYRVIARNQYGGSPSNVDCTGFPSAPSNLSATSNDVHSINLTWTSTSPVEDGFVVRRYSADYSEMVEAVLPANSTTYHDAGLSADTRYNYAVYATREGAWSSFSNVTASSGATGAPGAPVPRARPSTSTSAVVDWTSTSASVTSYRVQRSLDGEATWTTIVDRTIERSFRDAGVGTEPLVCYRVFATNGFGESGPSTPACTVPPAAPSGLTARAFDEYYTEATWTNNSNVQDGFEVWTYYFYDWGDGYYDYQEYSYWVPADARSVIFNNWETLYYVVATRDGGWSDLAFPVESAVSSSAKAATLSRLRGGSASDRMNRPRPGPAPATRPQRKK